MSDPVIFDWPPSIVPSAQLFHAPGQMYEGGFTTGGAEVVSPEPGGRSYLEMAFNNASNKTDARLLSWLFSKLGSGAVFRVPVFKSVQLVDIELLPPVPPEYGLGIPWEDDAGGEVLWGDGVGWGVEYQAATVGTALEGSTQIVVDLSAFGPVLLPGHVFGYADRSYIVDAISYDDAGIATVTVNPPLRTNVGPDDDYSVTFRPYMIVRAQNPDSFRQMFDLGRWVKPGNLTFMEVIL